MENSKWEEWHRKAKQLESMLEKKIQSYSSLAQRINANFLEEEGHSLIESGEEQFLAGEIERDLTELYECIQNMRHSSNFPLTNSQEAWIRRYYEIHFDFSSEFKNTSATVQRKRESIELMQSSNSSKNQEQSSSVSKLMKEKLSIANSMRGISEVISQAFETKSALTAQKSALGNSSGGLNSLTSNVPGIGKLIEGIQKKKYKESLVVTLVLALILCFTIWWLFLR